MVPGRDLGMLLKAREQKLGEAGEEKGLRVLVEDVDYVEEAGEEHGYGVEGQVEEERGGRGRSMMKVDSRERTELITPR